MVWLSMSGGRGTLTVVEQGAAALHFFHCSTLHGMKCGLFRYALSLLNDEDVSVRKEVELLTCAK